MHAVECSTHDSAGAVALNVRAPPQAAPPALRRPLGQMLVERGLLSPEQKLHSLALQAEVDARLGDILLAHGLIDKDDLIHTIADQFATEVADFTYEPPDPKLIDRLGMERCVTEGVLPWQRRDNRVLVASARPDRFAEIEPELTAMFGPVEMVVTTDLELHQAVLNRHSRSLARRAETRVPAEDSCRHWSAAGPKLGLLLAMAAVLACVALAPKAVFLTLLVWTLLTLVGQTLLKLAAWRVSVKAARLPAPAPVNTATTRLPTVSILVPLYREREIASRLVKRLSRLDYPEELLDVCLIVESDDQVTCDALDQAALPGFIRRIVVPATQLKTKPRALNYALDFCRGSIVGVYDAEDAPAPDQIRRVVQQFQEAPPEVVCLQGVLDYYNADANWMSRCFTIEYASWFRVILPGLLRLGMVIPLGGTTLFFRRKVLEAIGGWDAHNVTEDADLGIRLARRGFRTELLDSVTAEEANCRAWPWIKQRSRWLKGYAVTWGVHNRRPVRLWADLGAWRFMGVQLLLLGTLTQFAIAPVLWSFWLITLGFGHAAPATFGAPVIWAIVAIFVASEATSIGIRAHAVSRTGHRGLMRWVPTLYFYFPLATLASYKAALELLTKPFYWDKTAHGQTPAPRARRRASPAFRSVRRRA
ncbi:Glycosyl transferase, group 2 family protein [Candidatus Rhodobacter oscarellae]|uniref:Glycosyl transferase, group 2 family protein n=1 Tax=Candidatus Rhodobacter oscarellae TaxID=1675527 RepID=A0A0J9GTF7_9RHOB|nr:glycosyltransferase [Candidatus Rhodobacter lobularis]KMW56778.1 Glycosyl transferase, group 2 family protein [Candidatus Rhodobacter lobularis]